MEIQEKFILSIVPATSRKLWITYQIFCNYDIIDVDEEFDNIADYYVKARAEQLIEYKQVKYDGRNRRE